MQCDAVTRITDLGYPTAHLGIMLTHSRAGFHSFLLQCDAVARIMDDLGYRVTMLHGGKSQDQREESIKVGAAVPLRL